MRYFEAIRSLSVGSAVISIASGRMLTPSEIGQIWIGEHYTSHNSVGLLKSEIDGLWSVVESG